MTLLFVVSHLHPFSSRSVDMSLWHSSESTSILTDAWFCVAKFLWTHRRFRAPFDPLLQHLYVLPVVPLGRWKDKLQLLCMASTIML